MHQVESERERRKSSSRELQQCISDIRRRTRDEVLATLSRRPTCLFDVWTSYTIVRGARRVLGILLHFHPSSREKKLIKEDIETGGNQVLFEHLQELQNNEDKTPGTSSAIGIVSPRRDSILEWELGLYIPTSPVKDLSIENRIVDEARPEKVVNSAQNRGSGQLRDSVARSARTQGEVLFGGAESVDEWMTHSPILGVVSELTDGPTTPPPHLQLERNQLGVSLESTLCL